MESNCQYFKPIEFPSLIEAGLFISHKGKTSIKYEVGIFVHGDNEVAAHGHFVHVFVDSSTRKPCPFPSAIDIKTESIYVK